MWNNQSVSLILPTFREKNSIREVIKGFESLDIFNEIIVINNNAEPGTSEAIRGTSAFEIFESRQGYGAAIKCGIRSAKSELIVICEPDSTFDPIDLLKLLPFTDRSENVYGSRTINNFIWTGANMGLFLKWGNWFVAKLIELLFNTTYLSDVGCTFRVLKQTSLISLNLDKFSDDGRFGMELLLAQAMTKQKITQVPVNYLPRIGQSGYTGDLRGAFFLGSRMINLIILRRFFSKRNYYRCTK